MERKDASFILNALPERAPFARSELISALEKAYPHYRSSGFSWLIDRMLKEGFLFRVGFDSYSRKPLRSYDGGLADPFLLAIRSFLLAQDLRFPFLVFDSSSLNEGLNELIAHRSILVEISQSGMELAFHLLQSRFPRATILFNPSLSEREHYGKEDTVVVLPLFRRSPLRLGRGKMSLEKLIVDLFADRGLRSFFSEGEAEDLAKAMLSCYDCDEKAMLSYATRRRVAPAVRKVLIAS